MSEDDFVQDVLAFAAIRRLPVSYGLLASTSTSDEAMNLHEVKRGTRRETRCKVRKLVW